MCSEWYLCFLMQVSIPDGIGHCIHRGVRFSAEHRPGELGTRRHEEVGRGVSFG